MLENDSKGVSLCFSTVFKKLKKWPKPLLFARFSPFFQLFKNGSKRPKTTLGVLENDSKGFSLCFSTVFRKFKKWPKSTKLVRVSLYFLLDFRHFFNFLKTVQKGLKPRWECLKIILKVSLCFLKLFCFLKLLCFLKLFYLCFVKLF